MTNARRLLFASAVSGAMIAAGIFGATVMAKASPVSSVLAAASPSPSPGTFKSNEDPTHESKESATQEANESSGHFGPGGPGAGHPNETAAHEAGESAAREAAENSGARP
jgi:hypothetical protein